MKLNLKLNNRFLNVLIPDMLNTGYFKTDTFLNTINKEELTNKILTADYELIREITTSTTILSTYKTTSIGYGIKRYLSIQEVEQFIISGKLKKNTLFHLVYETIKGNVFVYINKEDIDEMLLVTDISCVHTEYENVYDIQVGDICNHNTLYFKSELHGLCLTIHELKRIEGLNRIDILYDKKNLKPHKYS